VGVGFRDGDRIRINKKENYEMDLDKLDFPYWDIFPLDKYFEINNPHGSPSRRQPFLPVVTSRGCPFECVFCSINNLWGRVYRKRSPENVLSELDYLKGKFGVKEILFEDDNLTLDNSRAKRIFQGMIDRGLDMVWSTPNGLAAQTLDDQTLELMKKSGCYSISIGVESGDEHILKDVIKKPVMTEKIKSVVSKAKGLGLKISLFFVIGLPGEARGHIRNTFKLAESLRVDSINFFFACPLPGTRLLELCRAEGLIKGGLEYSRLKSNRPYFDTACLSRGELINIVNRERLKLYIIYLLTNPVGFLNKLWVKLIRGKN
jgi:magnesium-protoporphyrin IX monomethyl ester (oxidative) cyclase